MLQHWDAMHLSLRVRAATPTSFAGRLREIAAEVDPNLQLRNVAGMEDVLRSRSIGRATAT